MRTRLRRPLRVTVGIVAVLVVGAGVSEAVARQALTERVTTALAGNLGSEPEVSFGSRPVLLAALDDALPSITMSGHADTAGYADVPVSVRLSDVTIDEDRHTTHVSGSRVTADVSTDAMTRRMASGDGKDAAMISGVTSDPQRGPWSWPSGAAWRRSRSRPPWPTASCTCRSPAARCSAPPPRRLCWTAYRRPSTLCPRRTRRSDRAAEPRSASGWRRSLSRTTVYGPASPVAAPNSDVRRRDGSADHQLAGPTVCGGSACTTAASEATAFTAPCSASPACAT